MQVAAVCKLPMHSHTRCLPGLCKTRSQLSISVHGDGLAVIFQEDSKSRKI